MRKTHENRKQLPLFHFHPYDSSMQRAAAERTADRVATRRTHEAIQNGLDPNCFTTNVGDTSDADTTNL